MRERKDSTIGGTSVASPALLLLVRWEATTPLIVVTLFRTLLPLLALALGLGLHRRPGARPVPR
ncbi:MAG: hypothetical protein DI601_11970 [Azospirillum brasilense]|nr:MAG: hypothetical protein DI601_11970 [Azospirillum brasilense]